jgi:hypothetical protein
VKVEGAWDDWPLVKEDALSIDLCFDDSDGAGCGCVGTEGSDCLKSGGVTVTEKSVCSG